jgi:putative FmdB family regulatory protein
MPIYEYKCYDCGHVEHRTSDPANSIGPCKMCAEGTLKRVFSFQVAPVMQAHFNRATNTVVSSSRQFARDLRVKGDQMTERDGIPRDLQPVDMSDAKSLGVTGEGLDSTNRARVAQGLPAVKIPGII